MIQLMLVKRDKLSKKSIIIEMKWTTLYFINTYIINNRSNWIRIWQNLIIFRKYLELPSWFPNFDDSVDAGETWRTIKEVGHHTATTHQRYNRFQTNKARTSLEMDGTLNLPISLGRGGGRGGWKPLISWSFWGFNDIIPATKCKWALMDPIKISKN